MTRHRAFCLTDLAGVFAGAALLSIAAASVLVTVQPDGELDAAARLKARRAKDTTQLRGIHQGMVLWAQNNKDQYPLPSEEDKSDFTVPERLSAKNTTANIMSIMIYNKFFEPALAVSPLETNPNIVKCQDYEMSKPQAATVPDKAGWDPSFAADFTGEHKGNLSYAHLQPSDKRLPRWSNTFSSSEMVLCTRGPEIAGTDLPEEDTTRVMFASPPIPVPSDAPEGTKPGGTRTVHFYGDGESWAGEVMYNDNSARMLQPGLKHKALLPRPGNKPARPVVGEPETECPVYLFEGHRRTDIPFFDEPDDATEANYFLGIFTEAGRSRKQFKSIWD